MKRRNLAVILIHFYITWMCVELIDQTFGVKICDPDPDDRPGLIHTLSVNLSKLRGYSGNCTCKILTINRDTNVTLFSNITACSPISLYVDNWNYAAECTQQPVFNAIKTLSIRNISTLTLNVTTEQYNDSYISGILTLTSLDSASISVICDEGEYYVPPSTLPPTTTTPTTTTTTELPIAETVVASAGTVFGGFVVLMLLISLGIWYKERRKRAHDAEMANIKKVIPDIEREKIDPEMTKYNWFKTLTIRLKRYYYGDGRRSKRGRGARGRSTARNSEEGATGTQARKRFNKLFRKKSASTSSSSATRDHSPIEDEDTGNEGNGQTKVKDEVFVDVSPQRGEGVFMDVRRPSLENLEDEDEDEDEADHGYVSTVADIEEPNTVITVHSDGESPRATSDQSEAASAEEELVSSLFGDFDEETDIQGKEPSSKDNPYEIGDLENVDGFGSDSNIDHQIQRDFDQDISGSVQSKSDTGNAFDGEEQSNVQDTNEEDSTEVSKRKSDSVSQISKISNGHPPEMVGELYAVIDKSNGSSFFRI